MVPAAHPLASVRDAFNAVFVEGDEDRPADVLRSRRGRAIRRPPPSWATSWRWPGNRVAGTRGIGCTCVYERRIRPMDDTHGQYYLNLHVEDRPGVLAEIADHFGRNGVSIERVWQEGSGDEATLVFITHRAQEGAFQKTLQELRELPAVRAVVERPARGGGRGMTADGAAPVARCDRGVPRPPAGLRRRRPSSRSARAARRSSGPSPLSDETGCDVWLKYDGANPTGSFKDRGMTLAISKAVEEGAKAVVCASTGNTSASAAAYAAKARPHLRGPGPEGQDRPRQDGADARPRSARPGGRRELRRRRSSSRRTSPSAIP